MPTVIPGSFESLMRSVSDFNVMAKEVSEALRASKLKEIGIVNDGQPDRNYHLTFNNIIEVAAALCDTPAAGVTFIDDLNAFSKAMLGGDDLPKGCRREDSYCNAVLAQTDLVIVEDSRTDLRVSSSPFVEQVRFYAGAPITTKDGVTIGALCVLDYVPRTVHDRDKFERLSNLAQVLGDILSR